MGTPCYYTGTALVNDKLWILNGNGPFGVNRPGDVCPGNSLAKPGEKKKRAEGPKQGLRGRGP